MSEETVALTATFYAWAEPFYVAIEFGDYEIARLNPATYDVKPSQAGHGDDSSYFRSEEKRIAEETAGRYLAGLFANLETLPMRITPQPKPQPKPQPNRTKETVVRIDTLDGKEIHRHTMKRYVYHRPNGSHYIVTLGYRKKVVKQDDGTYLERQDGQTVSGGIGI